MRYVFADLETTGLDPDADQILEIAILVWDSDTDAELHRASFTVAPAFTPELSDVVRQMHTESGLLRDLKSPDFFGPTVAAQRILGLLEGMGFQKGEAVLAGFSVHIDRTFIRRWMPELHAYLHYRLLDVSAIRAFAEMCAVPDVEKTPSVHRALADCEQALADLRRMRKALTLAPKGWAMEPAERLDPQLTEYLTEINTWWLDGSPSELSEYLHTVTPAPSPAVFDTIDGVLRIDCNRGALSANVRHEINEIYRLVDPTPLPYRRGSCAPSALDLPILLATR